MSAQRKALIIANDEYEQDALSNLLAPGADAEALRRVLGDPHIGGFAVQVVSNEPAHVIAAHIEDLFSDSRPDDVLLLHFSGHGLKGESGALFFAASNTRPNRLRATAVSADFVQQCMQDSRSRSVVLLLDCCYGGAFAQGVKVRAAGDVNVLDSFVQGRSGGRGRAVITASTAMEYAFEGDRLADDQQRRPSVFTSALVEGLATGDADRDEDGWVSLNELYDYVFDKVREQNPHQTPSRQVELEGELYLARSQRRRIRPTPIPPDLQAAIADQNMYSRRGAVHELQSRLASEDLPVAAGAYEALAELVRTDIQYVADLAAAALSQVAVRPEETEVHFGEQRQGSDPPHRLVRLLGPPIARACAPRASHGWIRVNETTGGFDISVDTTCTGTLRGTVGLKGPTGEAVIAVDVELLPQEAQISPTRPPGRPAYEQVDGGAAAVSASQPKGGSAARGRQEARSSTKRDPAVYRGKDTAEAATSQSMAARPAPAAIADELAVAPQSPIPTAPAAARPPGSRDAASGTWSGLLDVAAHMAGRDPAFLEGIEVPPIPNIGLSERFADLPYPLLDGVSPTIGWQFRPQNKGGPAYVIIRRTALGSLKAVETFPLTEDGWASAWRALLERNPDAGPQVLAKLRARQAEAARLNSPDSREVDSAPATSASQFKELTKLAGMLEKGLLTREEYDLMKAKLLGIQN